MLLLIAVNSKVIDTDKYDSYQRGREYGEIEMNKKGSIYDKKRDLTLADKRTMQ